MDLCFLGVFCIDLRFSDAGVAIAKAPKLATSVSIRLECNIVTEYHVYSE